MKIFLRNLQTYEWELKEGTLKELQKENGKKKDDDNKWESRSR